ncbi:MAG: ABC transporter permease, partial [Bacteroidota bacterium]
MIFILAWRNLWRNRRRTLITAAAIFFAVMLSVVMNSIQQGVYEKMIDNIVGLYSGYVQVHQKGYWDDQTMDYTFADAPAVREKVSAHPRVSTAVPRLESFALAASETKTAPTQVVGTDPELEHKLTKLQDKVVAGTFLTNADKGAMVAEGLAQKLGLGLGDTLVLMGQGYQGATAVGQYEIKALLHFGSPELNKAVTYLPLPEAQFLYAAPDRLTAYALAIDKGSAAVSTADQLEADLPAEDYEVMDWKEMMPEMIQLMEVDQGGNYVTLGILYLVVAFGIFGTILMMTQERRFEFGLMLSVGMKRTKLIAMTFLEMVFMAI